MELDSLYGDLFAGPPNRPPSNEQAEDVDAPVKQGGDDMFSGPPPKPAGSPEAEAEAKEDSQPSPAPEAKPAAAFSTAKLMAPPVRKKADPGKKPMPSIDIAKIQEEKEALMRRRAAAAAQDDKPAMPSGSPGSSSPMGAASGAPSFVRSGDSGGASAGAAADDAVATSGAGVSGGNSRLAEALYGSPDEEYDPAKPNDYDEFCRRRMRLKAEEELEKRRQEALARHQKGQAPPEPKEDDFATKMLKKMGWKDGQGLGKDGQGMATPLVLKKTDQRQGTIVEGTKREAPPTMTPPPAAKQAKAAPRPPSCVLLLNNLVGAGEVDEDLEEETAEEAGKYGKLIKCKIREMKGLPDDQAVRIFLHFEEIASATKALVDMNGRYFGGRVVKARFFDPKRFETDDLDNRVDE